jgi:hypothetical protein
MDRTDSERENMQISQHRREMIIREAVRLADRVIMESSDGSLEELNFLTASVAKVFIEKALQPFQTQMLKKDLNL